MKIVTVVGNRPQFIKAALFSRQFASSKNIQEILVHTGQHYDPNMSDVFFDELEMVPPQYNLEIGSGTHGAQTGRMLEAIENVLVEEKPDCVLVYGDTNSTLAGALASIKLCIPVAHVEAGLRSFNLRMPEEVNRILTDHVSQLLFAPTDAAVSNLLREGMAKEKIHQVGDVMFDAALHYGKKAEMKSRVLQKLGLKPKEYILATIHRAENTDDSLRLKAILSGLAEVSHQIPIVLPLHPRTRKILEKEDVPPFGILTQNLTDSGIIPHKSQKTFLLLSPVGYLDMVMLEKNAKLIATDSGGVQKEAYFYKVPCVTLREETEWVELLDSGWNQLVPPVDTNTIADAIYAGLDRQGKDCRLYGNGDAVKKIIGIMEGEIHVKKNG